MRFEKQKDFSPIGKQPPKPSRDERKKQWPWRPSPTRRKSFALRTQFETSSHHRSILSVTGAAAQELPAAEPAPTETVLHTGETFVTVCRNNMFKRSLSVLGAWHSGRRGDKSCVSAQKRGLLRTLFLHPVGESLLSRDPNSSPDSQS